MKDAIELDPLTRLVLERRRKVLWASALVLAVTSAASIAVPGSTGDALLVAVAALCACIVALDAWVSHATRVYVKASNPALYDDRFRGREWLIATGYGFHWHSFYLDGDGDADPTLVALKALCRGLDLVEVTGVVALVMAGIARTV